jgi:rubrerythrin
MNSKMAEAIGDAIKKEQSAYKLYLHLVKKAENPNAMELFRTVALQELKHEALLKEFLKTGDMIEAKENLARLYFDVNLKIVEKLSQGFETVGLIDGFELAIKREQDAAALYQKLSERADSAELEDVFYVLSSEEKDHERLLRKELAKM